MKSALLRLAWPILLAVSLTGCVGVMLDPEERPLSRAVDDFNTQAELNARLLGESGEMFANVNTTVIEGRVHLSGTVPTSEQRVTATRLAWDTPNVREVVNDIEVTDATGIGDVARDRWLSTQVRARILTDRDIRDVNYTIDTQNRVVYILGIAQNQTELNKVIRHARAVGGVKRVVNYAILKDDPRRNAAPRETYAHTETDESAEPPKPE